MTGEHDNYFSMLLVCRCLKPKVCCTCKPEDEGEYDHLDVHPPRGEDRVLVVHLLYGAVIEIGPIDITLAQYQAAMGMAGPLCELCERGKEACAYCYNVSLEDFDVICDCGLADYGFHLINCQEVPDGKWVIRA